MNTKLSSLDRRSFLRGVGGFALALPAFETFSGTAGAAEKPASRKRLACFYLPNGVPMPRQGRSGLRGLVLVSARRGEGFHVQQMSRSAGTAARRVDGVFWFVAPVGTQQSTAIPMPTSSSRVPTLAGGAITRTRFRSIRFTRLMSENRPASRRSSCRPMEARERPGAPIRCRSLATDVPSRQRTSRNASSTSCS